MAKTRVLVTVKIRFAMKIYSKTSHFFTVLDKKQTSEGKYSFLFLCISAI